MNEFNLAKTFEEELLCHLCYDLLKDPRDLDCPHVFCLECIKKLVGNSTTVECPECRHITFVPTDGMDMLKPNLRMRNMVEKLSHHNLNNKGNPVSHAVAARCPHHSEETLNFRCDDCNVLACQYCVVRSHKQHEIRECSDNGILHSKKLTFNRCQIDIGKLSAHLQHLTELEQSITKNCCLEESKIDQQVESIISDLRAKAQVMKNRINKIRDQRLETIREEMSAIKSRIQTLEQEFVSTASDPDEDSDRTDHKELIAEASKTSINGLNGLNKHRKLRVKFQTSRGRIVMPHWLDLGKLVYRRKLTLASEFGIGSFQKAQGIAVTKNGLIAVADSRANYVEVYRLEDLGYKRAFVLGASTDVADGCTNSKITRPLDVAVTSDGKFFVVDSSLVKIYSNGGKYETCFSTVLHDNTCTADKSAPQGITTTGSDVIVVADLGRQVVTLHTSSGSLLRLLKVDVDPRNRIATDGRDVFFTNYQEGKVCAIDFHSGDKLQQFDIPKVTAICCDETSGSIILGRNDGTQGSGVLEQYCMTTGQLIARLASNLYAALGMAITTDNKLIVADMISVKVYAIE